LTPNSLEQIFANVRELGEATDRAKEAEELLHRARVRLEGIAAVTRNLTHRPVSFAWNGSIPSIAAAIGCRRW